MDSFDDAIREHLDLKRRQGASEAELSELEQKAFGQPEEPEASEGAEEAAPALEGSDREPAEAAPQLADPRAPDESRAIGLDEGASPPDTEAEAPAAPPVSAPAESEVEAADELQAQVADSTPAEPVAPEQPAELPREPEAAPEPDFDLSRFTFEPPEEVPDVTFPEEDVYRRAGFREEDGAAEAELRVTATPSEAGAELVEPEAPPGAARVDEWAALQPEPALEPLVEHEEGAALESTPAEPVSPGEGPARPGGVRPGQIARSTAFFALATSLSRVAGLAREIVAAGFFGVRGVMSAFTIAFQIPNLVRALFADAAIQAAFVPVFTEELEKDRRLEAFRLASNLLFLAVLVFGILTALLVVTAPLLVPLFAPGLEGRLADLTVSLAQLLFPIVALLGISGLVVGILNSFHRFGVFAISPFFWNLAIIAVLVGLAPAFPEEDRIFAYAIGVLVGTVLQLAMVTYDLRNTPFRIVGVKLRELWTPGVKRVLLLMLPVTISLGLINFNLLINSLFGTLVSNRAPAAIDKAFRIYMLPQGVFSVAVATVVFPTLARFAARRAYDDLRATMANGMRMIVLLLVPAAAAILVLAEPMTQLVYERGQFGPGQTELVATALFWFAFALPLNGLFLLLARTFFSLQRPWVPSAIAAGNLLITAGAAAALYSRFEIAGIVAATVIATAASVVAQVVLLRGQLHGLQLARFFSTAARVTVAAGALAGASWLVWSGLDGLLGESLLAQIVSLGLGLLVGTLVYAIAVLGMQVPEAHQVMRLIRGRRGGEPRPAR